MPVFIHPLHKTEIEIPEAIDYRGRQFKFVKEKTAGYSTGGWYQDESGKQYLAKFATSNGFPYVEKLLNDLAGVCVGAEFTTGVILIGHGQLEGKTKTCLLVEEIPNYQDLEKIKSPSGIESESVALRKTHSTKFHPFFAYLALIANDDLNEGNLGVTDDGRGFVIDYGLMPTFLYPQQIEFASIPFHLASFIGHRNLNGMQLIRRRHFGHDDFLNPRDRLKPQKDKLKEEDISYLELLQQADKIIKHRSQVEQTISDFLEAVDADKTVSGEEKQAFREKYSLFREKIQQRISWMEENFKEDLEKLGDVDEEKRFAAIKWRLHPKFKVLMAAEELAFKTCAHRELEQNIRDLGDFLQKKSREEILALDLRKVEKSDIQEFAKDKFMLHNAIISGDYQAAKWLSENDICEVNLGRRLRTHNYQIFRTTPLHAAIALYHDKAYEGKKDELKDLAELIEVMREKFVAKNGASFNKSARDYKSEGVNEFEVEMTFSALAKYDTLVSETAQAATTIQRAFKAHQLKKPQAQEVTV